MFSGSRLSIDRVEQAVGDLDRLASQTAVAGLAALSGSISIEQVYVDN